MARQLREWASGKADYVAQRVYALLTKYTGIKFTVLPSFVSYKNKWGIFFGKLAKGSNNRWYRLNFTRGATDEIVSIDCWGKGKSSYKTVPTYTCSLNGWGISKVLIYLIDFIKTPEATLTEGKDLTDENGNSLRENADELKAFIAAFLLANPIWQNAWKNKSVDPKQYFDAAKVWIRGNQVNGAKYSNNPVLTTGMVNNNTATLIKQNPAVLGTGTSPSIANQAANSVPLASTVKTTQAGTESPIDMTDAYDEAITFNKLSSLITGDPSGPLAKRSQINSAIQSLIKARTTMEVEQMLVIWGRGGTGKTFTVEQTFEDMGWSYGEQYATIDADFNLASAGTLQKFFIENADKEIILVDDNDEVFSRPAFKNVWKKALATSPRGRFLIISKEDKANKDTPPIGKYPIQFKVIWLSNADPKTIFNDPSGALESRYFSINYNFTDEELILLIGDGLGSLYAEYEDILTKDEKAKIYYIFYQISQKRALQGQPITKYVSFRQFNQALSRWMQMKEDGMSFADFVQNYLNTKINATGQIKD
jgi:hypothetical protein